MEACWRGGGGRPPGPRLPVRVAAERGALEPPAEAELSPRRFRGAERGRPWVWHTDQQTGRPPVVPAVAGVGFQSPGVWVRRCAWCPSPGAWRPAPVPWAPLGNAAGLQAGGRVCVCAREGAPLPPPPGPCDALLLQRSTALGVTQASQNSQAELRARLRDCAVAGPGPGWTAWSVMAPRVAGAGTGGPRSCLGPWFCSQGVIWTPKPAP